MRNVKHLARWTASLVSGLAVLALLAYAGLIVAGYRPVGVYSGSMVPSIGVGSLAVDRPVPAASVRVGDVITFGDPYVRGRVVTHRVIQIARKADGTLAYRTKGDANPTADPWAVKLPGTVGRYEFDIPFAGYALVYAATREVRTALILLTAASVLFSLLRLIWRGPRPRQVEAV